jgi:hypothetical protein
MSENNNDARFFIMCGVPGAGKGNIACAMRRYAGLLNRNTVIIDQEIMIKMLFGAGGGGSNNANMSLLYQTIVGMARNCLKENYDVIMLGMFLVVKERGLLLNTIKSKGAKIIWCNRPKPKHPTDTDAFITDTDAFIAEFFDKFAERIFEEPTEEECEVVKIEDTDVFLKGENMPVIYGK